jgi:hypothetical protein
MSCGQAGHRAVPLATTAVIAGTMSEQAGAAARGNQAAHELASMAAQLTAAVSALQLARSPSHRRSGGAAQTAAAAGAAGPGGRAPPPPRPARRARVPRPRAARGGARGPQR